MPPKVPGSQKLKVQNGKKKHKITICKQIFPFYYEPDNISAVNEGHSAAFIQTLRLHEFALKWKLKFNDKFACCQPIKIECNFSRVTIKEHNNFISCKKN